MELIFIIYAGAPPQRGATLSYTDVTESYRILPTVAEHTVA